jgi:hypothetical protein
MRAKRLWKRLADFGQELLVQSSSGQKRGKFLIFAQYLAYRQKRLRGLLLERLHKLGVK